jgi:hypothetical protein
MPHNLASSQYQLAHRKNNFWTRPGNENSGDWMPISFLANNTTCLYSNYIYTLKWSNPNNSIIFP